MTKSPKLFTGSFANAIYFHLGGLDLYPEGVTE